MLSQSYDKVLLPWKQPADTPWRDSHAAFLSAPIIKGTYLLSLTPAYDHEADVHGRSPSMTLGIRVQDEIHTSILLGIAFVQALYKSVPTLSNLSVKIRDDTL